MGGLADELLRREGLLVWLGGVPPLTSWVVHVLDDVERIEHLLAGLDVSAPAVAAPLRAELDDQFDGMARRWRMPRHGSPI